MRANSSWSPMTSVRASIMWKPARIRPTVSSSRPDRAISVSAKTSPSRSTSAALWQAIRTRSPADGRVELGLDLGQLAREPLDALDPQVAGRLERARPASVESVIEGRLISRAKVLSTVNRPARVVGPAEVVAALLAEVVGLDQGDPGPFGEVVGDVAEAGGVVAVERQAGGERRPSPTGRASAGSRGRRGGSTRPRRRRTRRGPARPRRAGRRRGCRRGG